MGGLDIETGARTALGESYALRLNACSPDRGTIFTSWTEKNVSLTGTQYSLEDFTVARQVPALDLRRPKLDRP
jgi:hypothetical protein